VPCQARPAAGGGGSDMGSHIGIRRRGGKQALAPLDCGAGKMMLLQPARIFGMHAMRQAELTRKTKETQVRVALNLDGEGRAKIATGIGFLDHMLEQLARHSLIDLEVEAKGDLHIDFHHTTEDTGIVIGQAVAKALSERAGIQRYGDALIPMDETLTRVALDASNRPYLIWKVSFTKPKLGEMDTELFREWFHAFAQAAGVTLHVENLYGENNHHIIESCFKGLARALRAAVSIDPRKPDAVPSTKGVLGGTLA